MKQLYIITGIYIDDDGGFNSEIIDVTEYITILNQWEEMFYNEKTKY